jgi:hypothetical protein
MSNKYLEKAASLVSAAKEFKEIPLATKLSLGISGSGLAVGMSNLKANKDKNRADDEKKRLEEKSLKVLSGIHNTLKNSA